MILKFKSAHIGYRDQAIGVISIQHKSSQLNFQKTKLIISPCIKLRKVGCLWCPLLKRRRRKNPPWSRRPLLPRTLWPNTTTRTPCGTGSLCMRTISPCILEWWTLDMFLRYRTWWESENVPLNQSDNSTDPLYYTTVVSSYISIQWSPGSIWGNCKEILQIIFHFY